VTKKNKVLFFETPEDKLRVFQRPRLVMFSKGNEVQGWTNTQPLYFYPFSWLDYLNGRGVRELYIQDNSSGMAEEEITSLEEGKVHFEIPDERLIQLAKERRHKVSVICDIGDLSPERVVGLSASDFVRFRVSESSDNLDILSGLPNKQTLSCIKVYVGGGCDYRSLALQAREMGFDFLHVSKKLSFGSERPKISKKEVAEIERLQEIETDQFRVILPSSLEEKFARRFVINLEFGNVSSCDFSKYRIVLKGEGLYPCYTQQILSQPGAKKGMIVSPPKNCLDCACIYENDMLSDIKNKMRRYKNPRFALEYIENGNKR
jgi:hypothetical protein